MWFQDTGAIKPKFGKVSNLYGIYILVDFHSYNIYSKKKETSDFHGIVSFDPVKMLQQK